jgi:hypothetical protein
MSNNVRQVLRQARRAESAVGAATRRSINKMGVAAYTETMRKLSASIGLPQKRIAEHVKLTRASAADVRASVRILPHQFNLASFPGTRQTSTGKVLFTYTRNWRKRSIRAKGGGLWSKAWGVSKFYRGGFIVHGKTAFHRVGAKRVMTKGRYAGKMRQPIKPLYGPGTSREFLRNDLPAELSTLVATRMPPTMRHELNYALGRVGMKV